MVEPVNCEPTFLFHLSINQLTPFLLLFNLAVRSAIIRHLPFVIYCRCPLPSIHPLSVDLPSTSSNLLQRLVSICHSWILHIFLDF
ncbi:hypothetical protein NMG60_11002774 [Bertholletia excelsa]